MAAEHGGPDVAGTSALPPRSHQARDARFRGADARVLAEELALTTIAFDAPHEPVECSQCRGQEDVDWCPHCGECPAADNVCHDYRLHHGKGVQCFNPPCCPSLEASR